MTNAPVLSAPMFDCPFKLSVDASDAGVGAVLLEEGLDGVEHPTSYFSKKLQNSIQRLMRWALFLQLLLADTLARC